MNVHSVNKAAAEPGEKRRRGRPLVDDKRRIILDAALGVFAKKGYHGTSVPEVADAAGVGTGTLYRYFANKEALVNEVYRDAKTRLRSALMDGLTDPTDARDAGAWFGMVWLRLGAFAKAEPQAFRFLEMQDHVEYLDTKSRHVELSVLVPLLMAGKRLHLDSQMRASKSAPRSGSAKSSASSGRASESTKTVGGSTKTVGIREASTPVDILMALVWGAFVGLVKAARLGYLTLDDKRLAQAGTACWRLIAPELSRSRSKGT